MRTEALTASTFEIVLLGESQLSGYSESLTRRRSTLLTFRTWFAIQLSETDAKTPCGIGGYDTPRFREA
jgi:hypothetical protein